MFSVMCLFGWDGTEFKIRWARGQFNVGECTLSHKCILSVREHVTKPRCDFKLDCKCSVDVSEMSCFILICQTDNWILNDFMIKNNVNIQVLTYCLTYVFTLFIFLTFYKQNQRIICYIFILYMYF